MIKKAEDVMHDITQASWMNPILYSMPSQLSHFSRFVIIPYRIWIARDCMKSNQVAGR